MVSTVLGGYRLVRRLGEGSRAYVHLGHPVSGEGSQAALKAYRETTSDESIESEINALTRSAGPHTVALIDLTTTQHGKTALILERLSGRTLASLLLARTSFAQGEAVTMLAPLAVALARMHDAGVVHGAITAGAIGFTAEGAPVIACFGHAVLIESGLPPVEREVQPGLVEDLAAFARLVDDVLSRVLGADSIRAWVSENSSDTAWVARFSQRLFAWAQPHAVGFSALTEEQVRDERLVPAVSRRSRDRKNDGESFFLLIGSEMHERIQRARQQLMAVRLRFWVAGAAAAMALIFAFFVAPVFSGQPPMAPAPPPNEAETAVTPTATLSPVLEDDPVAAFRVLWEKREQCFRELSILCLDSVAQPGSTALAQDQNLVREIQAGGQLPEFADIGEIQVEERLGAAALLVTNSAESQPASILVMKGEAGWRIRDYLG